MGFRFFKRLNILPGVTLNLSKSGGSVSTGPRGARFTLGPQGARVTLGIPGTGLHYTTNFSLGKLGKMFGRSSGSEATAAGAETAGEGSTPSPPTAPAPKRAPTPPKAAAPPTNPGDELTSEHFDTIPAPDDQQALAAGCRALASGNDEEAFASLRNAVHLADGAFLAGVLALKSGRLEEATTYLSAAVEKEKELGTQLSQYGVAATMGLDVTEEVTAHVGPDIRGALLALAEAYQAQNRDADAVTCLERLRQLAPTDIVVTLSLADLLLDSAAGDRDTCRRVVQLTEGVENDSPVHAALLLYKAQALRALGLLDAASEVVKTALARKKDRPDELLRALRYERALVYETQGQGKRARAEFEKLYAEDPDYEDVAARLKV